MLTELHRLFRREVDAVVREVDAYTSDAELWLPSATAPNAGGTLVLHLAGNLQHYLGARIGGSGYRRDRDAEFARRDVSRTELRREMEAASRAIDLAFERLAGADLDADYPEAIAGATLSKRLVLLHLLSHLAYHLGQLDYHRRGIAGTAGSVGALAARELGASAG